MAQLTQFPQAFSAPAQQQSWISNLLWWLMLLSSAGVVVYGARYFVALPPDAHFARYILPLRLHIAGGIGALLAGPWQFSRKLRARALKLHRWLGRFYLLEVALAIAGFFMALVSKRACLPISASAFWRSCGSSRVCKPIAWYGRETLTRTASG